MRKEDLFENINEIDEKYIKIADTYNPKKKSTIWIKCMSVAACLVAIVGIGASVKIANMNQEPSITVADDSNAVEESNEEQAIPSIDQERFIAIDTLLASADDSQTKELAKKVCTIQVDKYVALYEAVASVDSEQLKESIGKAIEPNDETYYVSGHNDLQYIIKKTAGTYLLWEFKYFECDKYPYKDVLELIYDVHSEQDIKEICSEPSNVDNSNEGEALQQEIGNLTIKNSDSILSIYKILSSLTCYGPGNWDKINYGQNDAGMLNAVRMGRYLTLTIENGCRIDGLKYTAVSGMFYEYDGVAYNILSDEDANTVNQILQIDVY